MKGKKVFCTVIVLASILASIGATLLGQDCPVSYEEFVYELPLAQAVAVYTGSSAEELERLGFPFREEITKYHLFAIFTNCGSDPICLLHVRITWYNSKGDIVSTSSWLWDEDWAEPLLPGESVPLALEWNSRMMLDEPDHYELRYKVRCCENSRKGERQAIHTTNLRLFQQPGEEICITGVVTNESAEAISDYGVFAVLYNAEKEIIGVATLGRLKATSGFPLEAAESEPFQIPFDQLFGFLVSREVADFQVVVYPGRGWMPGP